MTIWFIYHIINVDIILEEKFLIIFYKTKDDYCPSREFIFSLDKKSMSKILASLKALEEKGNAAREPLSKYLDDGIFELRTWNHVLNIRLLYFFDENKQIVITNGFIKKTQKLPVKEFKLAKKYRNDYLSRKDKLCIH